MSRRVVPGLPVMMILGDALRQAKQAQAAHRTDDAPATLADRTPRSTATSVSRAA
ncbi:MAG: hypothetical protein ACRDKW_14865 [Actinomycetota bacterium]